MGRGAKKNPKAKSEKALAVDFKRVKNKVGKKLAPAQNATKVEFKSKGIVIRGQAVTLDKNGLAMNHRKQTLKEFLVQMTHHSERMRKDALMGLEGFFGVASKGASSARCTGHGRLSPRITDTEKSVRQSLGHQFFLSCLSVITNLVLAIRSSMHILGFNFAALLNTCCSFLLRPDSPALYRPP